MGNHDNDEESDESRYQELHVPELACTTPEHVLQRLPEAERYMVRMVSELEQREKWLRNVAVENRSYIVALDKRMQRVETFKRVVTGRWAVLAYFVTVAIPLFFKTVIEKFFK